MNALVKYIRVVESLVRGLGLASMYLLLVILAVLMFPVFARGSDVSTIWALETAQFAVGAYYTLGAGWSLQQGAHVRMDFLYANWRPRTKAVVDAVCRAARGALVAVTDVGQHQLWAARYLRHVRPRTFISSGGMGAMGFGIPAAIGAAIARPDMKVVAFVGDGGAQMTAEELVVAAEQNLPVTFVVFSNGTLGLVRQMQREDFGSRYFATDLRSPDFVKLASAYGVKGVRVSDPAKVDSAVAGAMRAKGPVLIEVRTDPEASA